MFIILKKNCSSRRILALHMIHWIHRINLLDILVWCLRALPLYARYGSSWGQTIKLPIQNCCFFLEYGSGVPDDGPRGNILSATVSADESW